LPLPVAKIVLVRTHGQKWEKSVSILIRHGAAILAAPIMAHNKILIFLNIYLQHQYIGARWLAAPMCWCFIWEVTCLQHLAYSVEHCWRERIRKYVFSKMAAKLKNKKTSITTV
jgi:hypothetical protein